jgi:uncharacterized delta-60 repeat protein
MKKILLIASIIFICVNSSFSQIAGSLDLSFDPGLGATNGSALSAREVYASVVLPNSQIIVGGYFESFGGSTNHNRIAKLNADGTIDESFISSISSTNTSSSFRVYCLALQDNGKLLVGGNFTHYNGYIRNKIVRINLDGTIDLSFDPGSGFAYSLSDVKDIKIQPDGKILVAGSFNSFNGYNYSGLVRLNEDGSLDNSFVPQTGGYTFSFNSIDIQTDGKIIAGGDFAYIGTTNVRVVRFNTDGSIDTSFNPNSTGSATNIEKILIQPDGKVLIAGFFSSFNSNQNIKNITRVDEFGIIDSDFNVGSGPSGFIYDLYLEPDGKILAVGSFTSWNSISQNRIARIKANGMYDSSFNIGSGATNAINCITKQPDGKYLIGGYFDSYGGQTRRRFARINGDNTSSIEQISESVSALFPNPTSGSFTIEFNSFQTHIVEIYNTVGKLIHTETITSKSAVINVNYFSSKGIYLVKVYNNSGEIIATEKIVFQ